MTEFSESEEGDLSAVQAISLYTLRGSPFRVLMTEIKNSKIVDSTKKGLSEMIVGCNKAEERIPDFKNKGNKS